MSKTETAPEKKWVDRVRLGGSWYYRPLLARRSHRHVSTKCNSSAYLGFRLVEVIDEQD